MDYPLFGAKGAELALSLKPDAQPPYLTVVELSGGLPEMPGIAIPPRPDNVVMEPNTTGWGRGLRSNWTLVRKSYALAGESPGRF